MTTSALETIDPITFTVLRNGFRAMCSQGSALVERVAWGPVITQGRDYSVGLLTSDGRSSATAPWTSRRTWAPSSSR